MADEQLSLGLSTVLSLGGDLPESLRAIGETFNRLQQGSDNLVASVAKISGGVAQMSTAMNGGADAVVKMTVNMSALQAAANAAGGTITSSMQSGVAGANSALGNLTSNFDALTQVARNVGGSIASALTNAVSGAGAMGATAFRRSIQTVGFGVDAIANNFQNLAISAQLAAGLVAGSFSNAFSNAGQIGAKALSSALGVTSGSASGVLTFFQNLITQAQSAGQSIASALGGAFTSVQQNALPTLSAAIGALGTPLTAALNAGQNFSTRMQGYWNTVTTGIRGAIQSMGQFTTNLLQASAQWARTQWANFPGNIGLPTSAAVGLAQRAIGSAEHGIERGIGTSARNAMAFQQNLTIANTDVGQYDFNSPEFQRTFQRNRELLVRNSYGTGINLPESSAIFARGMAPFNFDESKLADIRKIETLWPIMIQGLENLRSLHIITDLVSNAPMLGEMVNVASGGDPAKFGTSLSSIQAAMIMSRAGPNQFNTQWRHDRDILGPAGMTLDAQLWATAFGLQRGQAGQTGLDVGVVFTSLQRGNRNQALDSSVLHQLISPVHAGRPSATDQRLLNASRGGVTESRENILGRLGISTGGELTSQMREGGNPLLNILMRWRQELDENVARAGTNPVAQEQARSHVAAEIYRAHGAAGAREIMQVFDPEFMDQIRASLVRFAEAADQGVLGLHNTLANTTSQHFVQAWASFSNVGTKLGEGTLPLLDRVARGLVGTFDAINRFLDDHPLFAPIIATVGTIVGALTALGVALKGLQLLLSGGPISVGGLGRFALSGIGAGLGAMGIASNPLTLTIAVATIAIAAGATIFGLDRLFKQGQQERDRDEAATRSGFEKLPATPTEEAQDAIAYSMGQVPLEHPGHYRRRSDNQPFDSGTPEFERATAQQRIVVAAERAARGNSLAQLNPELQRLLEGKTPQEQEDIKRTWDAAYAPVFNQLHTTQSLPATTRARLNRMTGHAEDFQGDPLEHRPFNSTTRSTPYSLGGRTNTPPPMFITPPAPSPTFIAPSLSPPASPTLGPRSDATDTGAGTFLGDRFQTGSLQMPRFGGIQVAANTTTGVVSDVPTPILPAMGPSSAPNGAPRIGEAFGAQRFFRPEESISPNTVGGPGVIGRTFAPAVAPVSATTPPSTTPPATTPPVSFEPFLGPQSLRVQPGAPPPAVSPMAQLLRRNPDVAGIAAEVQRDPVPTSMMPSMDSGIIEGLRQNRPIVNAIPQEPHHYGAGHMTSLAGGVYNQRGINWQTPIGANLPVPQPSRFTSPVFRQQGSTENPSAFGSAPQLSAGRFLADRFAGSVGHAAGIGAGPHGPRSASNVPPEVAGSLRSTQGSTFDQKAPQVMSSLMRDLHLTREQAAGVLGSLGHESAGFNVLQEVNPRGGRGGLGWGQWTGPRRVAFENWASQHNLSTSSDAANYGFLVHELQTSERNSLTQLRNARTVPEATQNFEQNFERAGVINMGSRNSYAQRAAAAFDRTPQTADTGIGAAPQSAGGVPGAAPSVPTDTRVLPNALATGGATFDTPRGKIPAFNPNTAMAGLPLGSQPPSQNSGAFLANKFGTDARLPPHANEPATVPAPSRLQDRTGDDFGRFGYLYNDGGGEQTHVHNINTHIDGEVVARNTVSSIVRNTGMANRGVSGFDPLMNPIQPGPVVMRG